MLYGKFLLRSASCASRIAQVRVCNWLASLRINTLAFMRQRPSRYWYIVRSLSDHDRFVEDARRCNKLVL
jgi:hypothetical protein